MSETAQAEQTCDRARVPFGAYTDYEAAMRDGRAALASGDRGALAAVRDRLQEAEKGIQPCVRDDEHVEHRSADGHEWIDGGDLDEW